ncbi:hypothetical protein GBA52_022103 [Prunus armeniaca]|nr:hypothetical protein GBA52_022103 [Prunus armeniaca]
MAGMLRLAMAFSVLLSLSLPSSHAQTGACGNYKFTSNKIFTSCSDLPYLNSFLHWTFEQSTGKLQMAYRHTGITTSNWVAWAINPNLNSESSAMLGAQSLVAFQQSNGTTRVYKSPISSYQTNLAEGNLDYVVSDLSAEYLNNDEMIIFATWTLPTNSTTILQVWQQGPVSSDSPSVHPTVAPNTNAKQTLNLLSGQTASSGGGGSRIRKKNIHGILNAVSWGVLMPFGAMVARYLKVFALLLRPNKDHKFRFHWNIYHHATGYAVIILSIVNIFEGFDILQPEKRVEECIHRLDHCLGCPSCIVGSLYMVCCTEEEEVRKGNRARPNGVNGYVLRGERKEM